MTIAELIAQEAERTGVVASATNVYQDDDEERKLTFVLGEHENLAAIADKDPNGKRVLQDRTQCPKMVASCSETADWLFAVLKAPDAKATNQSNVIGDAIELAQNAALSAVAFHMSIPGHHFILVAENDGIELLHSWTGKSSIANSIRLNRTWLPSTFAEILPRLVGPSSRETQIEMFGHAVEGDPAPAVKFKSAPLASEGHIRGGVRNRIRKNIPYYNKYKPVSTAPIVEKA